MKSSPLPPLLKTVHVPCSPQEAFRLFTEEIHQWWPLESHSIHRNDAHFCGFERRAGGRIFERSASGTECDWGRVKTWDPPHRLVFSWHPGRDVVTAQTVEVRFTAEGDGTRVHLTHSGWERLIDSREKTRGGYDLGWNLVFVERYAGHVCSRHVLRVSL
jgi:uncharacterized protein YndB with AHSA1/START domain